MASRYWVGGTATWDGTAGTKWATTSGGAGGASAPTAADDVFFDGNSGTGTVTLATGQSCLTLDFTGFTGTFAHNSNVALTVAGNLYRLSAGMTFSTTASGTTARIDFTSTSGTCLITTAGKSMCSMTFNGVGGTFQLQDALTTLSTHTVTLTNGTLNTNGQTCSWGLFSSANTNSRTLTLGASQITLTGTNATVWNVNNGSGSDATAMTLTAGTSTITVAGSTTGTSGNTFAGGGRTYNNVVFNGPTRGTVSYQSSFANLTFLGVASTSCRYTVAVNQTVSGTFTCTGLSATQRPLILGAGTTFESTRRTVTVGAVSFSNCDFQSIGISGVTATGTRLGDATNNSGITFDSPRTVYWRNTLGGNWSDNANWSLTSGGAGGADFPLPQDTVVFDANSLATAGQTVTADIVSLGLDVSFAACATSPTLALRSSGVIGNSLFGSLTLKSGMTITGSDEFYIRAASAKTITSAGVSFSQNFVQIAPFGSYSLVDALTVATNRTFQVQFGTFDANGQNVTCGLFNGSGTNARTITLGSGTWTLTGTGTVWNFTTTTNLTYNVNTSTVVVSDTSSATKTIVPPSGTAFSTLTISPGGTGPIAFSGTASRSMTNFNVTGPKTIQWVATSTYTITTPTITSSKSQPVTFLSSTPGTQYTLSVASGTVGSRFMSIFDCIGTGGATFVARESYGNNTTGWTIVPPRRNLALADTNFSVRYTNTAGQQIVSSVNSGVGSNGSYSFLTYVSLGELTGSAEYHFGIAATPTNQALNISAGGFFGHADPVGVVTSTVRAVPNTWYSQVVTWDATNSRSCLYINGYLVSTRTGTATAFTDGVIVAGRFPFSDSFRLSGEHRKLRVFGRELTAAEVLAWSQDGTEPATSLATWNLSEGTGTNVADSSGNSRTGTLTGAAWVADSPVTARSTAANRQSLPAAATPATAATGTITVTDYQYLAGKNTEGSFAISDYTLMTGGSFDILGVFTLTEGVDFNAVTSNTQTATNVADAINTAAGETIATAAGSNISISAPGSLDGGQIIWGGSGVTPTTTTLTGGYDVTELYFGSAFQAFQTGGGGGTIDPGLSNSDCATNIATAINGGDVTATADGSVVTITYNTTGTAGNSWAMSQQAQDGGTISNGLTLSGATLSGGAAAIAGRNTASNRVQL